MVFVIKAIFFCLTPEPFAMSIKEEIHQGKFRNEYQRAFLNVLYTNNYLIDHVSSVFKKYDVTRQQFNVLRILRGQHPNPSTVNLIKERMLDKMSDASRIVERLRAKGLVTRGKSKGDRRAAEIKISSRGLKLLADTDHETVLFDDLMKSLSQKEAKQLNMLLDKVRQSS